MTDTAPRITWTEYHRKMQLLAEYAEEWQGFPVPVEGFDLILNDRYPEHLRQAVAPLGGPVEVEEAVDRHAPEFVCHADDVVDDGRVRNEWWSRARNCHVLAYEQHGRVRAITIPQAPDRSMDRMTFWLNTLGASDAWDENAERRARVKLQKMVTAHQWRHYDLTGSFLERSPRSDLHYVFRRLRPTLALSARWRENYREPRTIDSMRCLAVLCLHPIGYYHRTWAGCMVPTDDVIAHLSWMRGDEAGYWKCANQHEPSAPEAGL